jgi:hypothetical protein
MIGSETHVIMVTGNIFNLNNLPNEAGEGLFLCQSIPFGKMHRDDGNVYNPIAYQTDQPNLQFSTLLRYWMHLIKIVRKWKYVSGELTQMLSKWYECRQFVLKFVSE